MKTYELSCLLSKELKENEVQTTALEVESLIQNEGGILTRERRTEDKELTKEIEEKKRVLVLSLKFQVDPEKVEEIKREVKAKPEVLRSMLEKKEAPSLGKTKKKRPAGKPTSVGSSEEEAKVELQKIEEKLDEILNESR